MKLSLILFFIIILAGVGYELSSPSTSSKSLEVESKRGRREFHTLHDLTDEITSAKITVIESARDSKTNEFKDAVGETFEITGQDLAEFNQVLSLENGVYRLINAVKFCIFHADYKLSGTTAKGDFEMEICLGCGDVLFERFKSEGKARDYYFMMSTTQKQEDEFKQFISRFHPAALKRI